MNRRPDWIFDGVKENDHVERSLRKEIYQPKISKDLFFKKLKEKKCCQKKQNKI